MNPLSELHEGLGISVDAVRANKLRSTLATLGIVIGIVTVTLMGSAIHGLNQAFIKSVSSLGADVFYVQRNSWFQNYDGWMNTRKRRPIRLKEAEAMAQKLKLASAVAPAIWDDETVRYKTRSASLVDIVGTTEGFLETSGVGIAEGRFLTAADGEGSQPVCVIGNDVVTNLFRGDPPLGARIKVADQSFEVVGVLEKQGSMLGWNLDNRVIIPIRELVADIWHRPNIDEIDVKAADASQVDEAKEELRQTLRNIRHLRPNEPDDFAINQQDLILTLFHETTRTIAIIGLFITSLALFVGGIGIMNIMFVSVAERTREIGVRKALGAKNRSIMLQFLVEAACICLMGGMIGLAIAWVATLAVSKWAFPTSMSGPIVGMALLVSAMTGVVAGFVPAWRAARMDPVEALRNET
ncbi:MAG TPA: ABC transporter permease [Verrucomicrobiae bacterium]|jgi:putative ABC transport system permease protein|nr:ABC transporter permease [Verrucomicrobiae bacterium]